MARTGRSLLVAGLIPIASLFATAASAILPTVVAAPAAPTAPQEPKGLVALPFRSLARTRVFVDAAILRFVCPRSYSALRDRGEVPCSEIVVHTVQTEQPSVSWTFQRRAPNTLHTLELVAAPSPTGGYDLHLFGVARDVSGKEKPNPELEAVEGEFEQLLKDLSSAPLGSAGDGLLSYQLSYVQADRAVAVLRTLGYAVVEYTKKLDDAKEPTQTVFDNVFEQIPALGTPPPGGALRRPVVIKLADSEETSLVSTPIPNADPELSGGQPLNSVPDAAPQQRLLIVYDENDLDSLDRLLERLEREIDVSARQILIEALVIELDHDRLLDLGIEVKGKKDNFDFSFERQTGGLLQPLILTFTRPTPRTLLELSATLRVLVERGQATVLSRPSVFVLDGRQARIKVGENVPFTKKVTIGDSGLVIAETDYLKTGIILNLRPRAAADNSDVTLQVEAIVSSPGPSQVVPGLGALLAPTLQSRQIQTLVKVANDTPFVIGGLIAQNDQHSISGVPGLSRIRFLGLGALFRKKNVSNDRREVIVVITPHIVPVDDPTFAYTIPRDAGRADAEPGARGAGPGLRSFPRRAPSCKPEVRFPVFDPAITQSEIEQGSIFDSLDAELFRNVYRLRGNDIFDLAFVTRSADVQGFTARTREIADTISKARFSRVPRIDRPQLEEEVLKRLLDNRLMPDRRPEANERFVKSFLTFFEGEVPGEDILVHHMMIRLIEKLDFGSCVPPDSMIYFPEARHRAKGKTGGGLDLEFLTSSECLRSCLDSRTVALAFPPPSRAENDDFLKDEKCLGLDLQWIRLEPDQSGSCVVPAEGDEEPRGGGRFSPPMVRLACVRRAIDDDGYLARLRGCNQVAPGGWQTILLDSGFRRRGRNSIGLLQSVLALEKLLEINDSHTFPRTLRDFHVGRELVLPTREDLQTRRHLIDRDTARLFYETLDYYAAFAGMYEQLAKEFDAIMREVEESVLGKAVPREEAAAAAQPMYEPEEVIPAEPPPPPP